MIYAPTSARMTERNGLRTRGASFSFRRKHTKAKPLVNVQRNRRGTQSHSIDHQGLAHSSRQSNIQRKANAKLRQNELRIAWRQVRGCTYTAKQLSMTLMGVCGSKKSNTPRRRSRLKRGGHMDTTTAHVKQHAPVHLFHQRTTRGSNRSLRMCIQKPVSSRSSTLLPPLSNPVVREASHHGELLSV